MVVISVIIPVYNTEPYLRQCLDSVRAQTFTDYELILVDDGSTDNSGAICDRYAERDDRIRVIHQQNRGQGHARNVGTDQAGGKYVIYLDSDDYWLPTTLETLYSEAERNQTQVLVFGAKRFWEGLKPSKHLGPDISFHAQNGVVKSGPESLKAAMDAHEYYDMPWLRLYLLEHLQENGLRFDEGIIHEDATHSFLAALLAERVECIGKQFYWRRIRPGSTMTSKTSHDSAHGYRVAMDSLLDAYETRPLSALGREQLARYIIMQSGSIRGLFRQAIGQDRKAAAWIQRDVRRTLKRTRVLPSRPWLLRLAACSLYIDWLFHGLYRILKRQAHAS